MINRLFIARLKFSPGTYKEFRLIGTTFEKLGISVSYLLSDGFKKVAEKDDIDADYLTSPNNNIMQVLEDCVKFFIRGRHHFIKVLNNKKAAAILFFSMHPLNISLAKLALKHCKSFKIIFYLHEPFQPDKSYFNIRQRVIVYLQEYLQKKMVFLSDCVVTPSPFANDLFIKYYPTYNRSVHTVPLCIPDSPAKSLTRSYVVMPGHMFPDGRVDDFCALLEQAAQKGCSFRFKVVTSSYITNFLRRKISDSAMLLLDIVEKRPLSDEEINEYVANAFAVLLMHKRGSQSGVTPVAFMNGTPVVARNIPMFSQFVIDSVNGKLVSPAAHPSEWIEALEYVKSNIEKLSKNARDTYNKIFHEDNLRKYLYWIVDI